MGGQDLLLSMEFKFLIMMIRPQNITVVCQFINSSGTKYLHAIINYMRKMTLKYNTCVWQKYEYMTAVLKLHEK